MVNNALFKLEEVPRFHPITQKFERLSWWKEQKRRCIEGYWQSGKWMPGPLYYYINFHHIEIERPGIRGQVTGLPLLRDIDWELFFYYEECRGFSGFSDDLEHTCHRYWGPDREIALSLGFTTEEELGNRKYIPAREYLRMNHGKSLGKAEYMNEAQNFISIQARGGGKSFMSAAIISHNYLFAGATDYDLYFEFLEKGEELTSDTIVGAIDTKYTVPLISKVKYGWDHLPGKETVRVNGQLVEFDCPLWSPYSGSLGANKHITSDVHGAKIYHRTFKDNPTAGNAGRPNLAVLDEVGFFTNIVESLASMEGSQASKDYRNLVIWMLGTGGLIQGAAAKAAEQIFRDPGRHKCLVFEDEFEQRGEIGYFVPVTKTRNRHKKGPNLITDVEASLKEVEYERAVAKSNPDPRKYQGLVINAPLVPSEAFLDPESSFFPAMLLKDHDGNMRANPEKYLMPNYTGTLKYEDGVLRWETDTSLTPIRDYPLQKGADKKGCIEIFVKPQSGPNGIPDSGRYIIGCDTVDKAASTTDSLYSVIVFDRWTGRIVAEFTGRREDPNEHYEITRRLALYYNAKIMYEQALTGLYTYLDNRRQTHLLADTPTQLRNSDTFKAGTNTSKGIPPSNRVNATARDFIKSWLLESADKSKEGYHCNVYEIRSQGLIQELLKWHKDGNFDRVSALGMVMWYDNTLYKETQESQQAREKSLSQDAYWKKMGVLKDTEEPTAKDLAIKFGEMELMLRMNKNS